MHNYYAQPIFYTDVTKWCESLTDWSIPLNTCVSLRTHLVGDLLVFLQEHLQLTDADAQVSVRVLVGDVEAEGTKFTALQDDSVEQTQGLEQVLELIRLKHNGGAHSWGSI